jgi:DNA primase large subunit
MVGLLSICSIEANTPMLLIANDHEEVGSDSTSGAGGSFLQDTLRRMYKDYDEYMNMIRTDVESRMNKIIENSAIGKSFGQPIDWKNKNSWLYDYLESLQKEIKIIDNEAKSQIDIELKGLDLPPCILQGINLLILTGELEHYFRVHLGSYLLKVMDIKLIQNIFSFANDYGNGYETMKQLDSLKNYNPYSCKNATFNGICPFGMNYKKCPFYDLSDGWLGRLFIKE